jgi:holo-[acyl-carrier protein] synthase
LTAALPLTLVGIGLDLIDLNHFSAHYSDNDPDILARCFTEQEIVDAGSGEDRLERLAVRFAAKEATFKSLGGGQGIALTDIEYCHSDQGQPHIVLSGAAKVLAKLRGATTFYISVSHSASSAAAVVIALSSGCL